MFTGRAGGGRCGLEKERRGDEVVWEGGGLGWQSQKGTQKAKKRSSQATWIIMQPGNSFPRSALFLKASMWETGLSCKGTEGPNILVI
jgi:hypothetical protein